MSGQSKRTEHLLNNKEPDPMKSFKDLVNKLNPSKKAKNVKEGLNKKCNQLNKRNLKNSFRNSNTINLKNSSEKMNIDKGKNIGKDNSKHCIKNNNPKSNNQKLSNVYKSTNPKMNNFELCRNNSEKILNNVKQKYLIEKCSKNSQNNRKKVELQKNVSEKQLLKVNSKNDLIKDYFLNLKYHSIENIKKLTTPIATININALKREQSLKQILISDKNSNSISKGTPKNFKPNPKTGRNSKHLQFENTMSHHSLSKPFK